MTKCTQKTSIITYNTCQNVVKTQIKFSFVIVWMLNLYFFILMCQSWSRENKYSISLIWAYQLDMVVIMKLWFIIIIIQGATFINNNNMFFPVLFSQSPHSCFRMDLIFNILREKKKQTRNFSLKSWLSLSGEWSKSAFGQKCSLYPFSPFIFIKRVMVNIISMTSPEAHYVAL